MSARPGRTIIRARPPIMANSAPLDEDFERHLDGFGSAGDALRALFLSSAEMWVRSLGANAPPGTREQTLSLMDDLSRGLMVKIFLAIVLADQRVQPQERELAKRLIYKLWGQT